MKTNLLTSMIVGCILLFSMTAPGIAAKLPEQSNHSAQHTARFQQIEQPLSHKIGVTLGGMGLIGLELWWFLFSRP
jgi:plastocyanin domain-containing protein